MSPLAEETPFEAFWRQVVEDSLIAAYVPEAELLSHQEALDLALSRDLEAARRVCEDATTLQLEAAVKVAVG